jgi:hypothetical protein
MKKVIFALIVITSVFGKCGKDNTPAPPPEPGTGDYAPYTLGSTFVYESARTTPAGTVDVTVTVTKDTTVDGLVYKKLESSNPTELATRFVNYTNGVQREASFNVNLFGTVVPKIIIVNLKENEAVNGTWNENISFNFSQLPGIAIPVNFKQTVTEKGTSKMVLTTNYTNVIGIKTDIAAMPPSGLVIPPGITTNATVNNFYAKGKGLIERTLTNQTIKLKSATIR